MPPGLRTAAVVLRVRPLKEHDLIVELLGEETGRISVVARGARKSQRRFGGALELGTRLVAEVQRHPGRDLHGLLTCDVTAPLHHARGDLDRIAHAAYVLEIAALALREDAPDPAAYALVCGYLDTLEAAPASPEALLLWELAMLSHQGYGMGPEQLVAAAELPATALPVLRALLRGETGVFLGTEDRPGVRRALERLWHRVVGRPLRTARFVPC